MRPLHERSEMCAYSSYLFSFASRGTVDQDIQSAAAWRDYEGSSNICRIHQPKPGLIGTMKRQGEEGGCVDCKKTITYHREFGIDD